MLSNFFLGGISFVFLVFASWCVGEGGEILGDHFDASVIGGLLIAWLNTAPETIFFVTALMNDNPRFAMGAVSGSAITVCTVAVGVCLYIGANASPGRFIRIEPAVKKQAWYLAGSCVVPLATCVFGFNAILGVVGCLTYCAFVGYSLFSDDDHDKRSDKDDLEMGEDIEQLESDHQHAPVWKGSLYLIVGGALILIFSSPFIEAVVQISADMQVSSTLLAFFLAPVASEMPEILESISLSRKGHHQAINIAYANLVGGTITKTTLLTGIFSLFAVYKEFQWEAPNYSVSFILVAVCAFSAALMGIVSRKQTSIHGAFLLVLFLVCAIIQYQFNGTFASDVVAAVAQ